MKFASDQVICCETAGHHSISNSFEYDNKNVDFTVLKSGNGALEESQDGGLKCREGDANCLQYERGFENEQRTTGLKVDFPKEEEEVQYFDTQSVSGHSSLELESLEKPVFYIDKNVMEREPPELMVCYEENVYHVVKDICIDKGVPSEGRIWFDADVDEKISNKLVSGENDMNNDIVKENVDVNKMLKEDVELPVENGLKSSIDKEEPGHFPISDQKKSLEEKHFKHEVSLDCEDIMPTEETKDDARKIITHDASEGIVSLGYLFAMPEFMDEDSNPKTSKNNADVVEQPHLQCENETEMSPTASDCKELTNGRDEIILESPTVSGEELKSGHEEGTLEKTALNFEAQKADNKPDIAGLPSLTMNPVLEKSENSPEEAESPNQSLHSISEESNNATSDESSCHRNEETRSVALDMNPCEGASSGQKQCPHNGSSDHLDARISSKLDSSHFESASNHLHYNHGESSFSAAVPVSGLITYSGPIAYSGNLSLRSDSSTTSTRSFAFPVLQSEWSSSPVRMAKADRRHAKHRSWRQGLLCCRF